LGWRRVRPPAASKAAAKPPGTPLPAALPVSRRGTLSEHRRRTLSEQRRERPSPGKKKPDKPPIQANVKFTGRHVYAKTSDPKTWASFDTILRYWQDHLRGKGPPSGLCFALNGDGIIGIDLDGCREPKTKAIEPWALGIIKRFCSYTEISPSGTGIRIFLRGRLPAGGRRKGQIEVYGSGKFLSVTGHRLTAHGASARIEDRSAELLAWHREVFGDGAATSTSTKEKASDGLVVHDPPALDQGRLNRLFLGKPKAKAVFDGQGGYASQSESDLALANYATAAGWTAQQTCDLLVAARHNAGEPIKPADYFARTIGKAREGCRAAVDKGKRPSSLSACLAKLTSGTDAVNIGSPDSDSTFHGEVIEGATMADVAKLVDGVRYLVRGWIPFAMVTGIVGEPGKGKSAFALWVARTIVMALRWFTGAKGPAKPSYVIWVSTESDMAITLQRIRDWGIPVDRIILPFKDDPLASVNLKLHASSRWSPI